MRILAAILLITVPGCVTIPPPAETVTRERVAYDSVRDSPALARCAKAEECSGRLDIPPAPAVLAALREARDEVRSAVRRGEIRATSTPDWEKLPRVVWEPCWFWVEGATWMEGGVRRRGRSCAAGVARYARGEIAVSTQEPQRTIPLVRWETRNYFLVAIGRTDLSDWWMPGKGDR